MSVMARKRYKPEEMVAKLRQVDVLVSQGESMVDAIRQIHRENTFLWIRGTCSAPLG
jgi:putative transposase